VEAIFCCPSSWCTSGEPHSQCITAKEGEAKHSSLGPNPDVVRRGKEEDASDNGHLKTWTARSERCTVGAGGSHQLHPATAQSELNTRTGHQLRAERKQKNVENLLARTPFAGLATDDGGQRQPIRRHCQEPSKLFPSIPIPAQKLNATEEGTTSRAPSAMLLGRALHQAARYLPRTSVKGDDGRDKGQSPEQVITGISQPLRQPSQPRRPRDSP